MAGDHKSEGVSSKGVPDRSCRTGPPNAARELSVRDGLTWWNEPSGLVHASLKWREACHVELHLVEPSLLALEELNDLVHCLTNGLGRIIRAGVWKALFEPRSQVGRVSVRQIYRNDAARSPGDCACAKGGIEERVGHFAHGPQR